jgi:transcriptional regulator with XRE-family HTH domain
MGNKASSFRARWRHDPERAAFSEQEAAQASALTLAFGDRIAKLRCEKCLSVAEASKRAGISRQHLYRIEKGIVSNVGRETIIRIAKALEVKETLLLGTKPSSEADAILKVLWQYSSNLTSDDYNRLREIEQNLLGTLQDTGRIAVVGLEGCASEE